MIMKKFVPRVLVVVALLTSWLGASVADSASSWEDFQCGDLRQKTLASKVQDGSAYDVVILGGDPSGVAAAKSAADKGAKVLLLSESSLFGGAIANGLSATDLGSVAANVGLSKKYLQELVAYYHTNEYRSEPKVAECIFESWLDSDNISLGINTMLDSAKVSNGLIQNLTFHTTNSSNKITVSGKTFVDASYAGDLMYLSGVKTRLGMADFYSYGEKLTEARAYSRLFRLTDPELIQQAQIDFAKLPQVVIRDNLDNYRKDILQGMPSFTYRLCLTRDKSNQIPFSKMPGYETYAPAWRTFMLNYFGYDIQKDPVIRGNGTLRTQLWTLAVIPNNKYDLNSSYTNFTNMPMTRDYFTHLDQRPAILEKYSNYLKSFLYFLQNDDSVPPLEKEGLSGFGLCADEFTSTQGWPEQPYLREGRRLIGQTTITARDLIVNRQKPDAIAAGSYGMDSKPAIFTYANGEFARDKFIMYRMPIYDIPFSAMLPKTGPKNLIVSVGISASPSAFGSIRMEPQFIELGQAAGFAAALASQGDSTFSSDLLPSVKDELAKVGGFTSMTDICFRLDPNVRSFWGFKKDTCQTRHFGLIIIR